MAVIKFTACHFHISEGTACVNFSVLLMILPYLKTERRTGLPLNLNNHNSSSTASGLVLVVRLGA